DRHRGLPVGLPQGVRPEQRGVVRRQRRRARAEPRGLRQMNADLWLGNYQRKVAGVPVSGDTFVFYVSHGNLISFGASRWGRITTSPVPSIPPTEAFAHLANYMGITDHDQLTVFDAGSLVFTPLAAPGSADDSYGGPVGGGYDAALTYRISFQVGSEAPTWEALVDA